jgi:hypothetical protein
MTGARPRRGTRIEVVDTWPLGRLRRFLGQPVGVLPDRDIVVRAVARGRHEATADDVMT